ncbi:DUF551 domain-containing protein [Salmonella enterica subsp. enterica serovar Newport]|uniref:DUF551 domain-containing protein n=3 Tax=Salmonella enterica TaxID=28901 RepID=A0A636IGV6_SALNE|nr:DUF551 domain-containing protein [Salmonella enterica]EDH6249431.1 DUF551 domain-containing protein [Salmonella enterica subsp. enterica serovar Newport]EDI0328444.1 DUF551 domain-containing protein [Salmonella enterica subsp. enterica serovar Newport]EDI0446414.1 DUF551 domain-containing protein [Salmonella enterica subsp. enterica serovar Newport]
MTTITKERIELFIKNPLENGLTRGEQMELARIAMASLEAKPVRYLNKFSGTCVTLEQQSNAADDVAVYMPLYAAPPATVVPEKLPCSVELKPGLIIGKGCKTEALLTALRRRAEYYAKLEAMTPEERAKHGASIEAFKAMLPQPAQVDKEFIPKNLDKALGVVGVALPESKEEFNFQIERWIQRLIDRVIRYADEFKEQPAPVVPDEMATSDDMNLYQKSFAQGWNACRATMLHGAKPVSQTYKSQHTQFEQVADLYEMQFDDGRTCAFHTDAQKAAQWLQACDGNRVQEYVKLERLQNALSGNSPVIPDGWISCSERMPDNDESKPIAIFTGKCLGQGMFVATYDDDGFFDYWEGMEIIGVTHWMPLPEPPQK